LHKPKFWYYITKISPFKKWYKKYQYPRKSDIMIWYYINDIISSNVCILVTKNIRPDNQKVLTAPDQKNGIKWDQRDTKLISLGSTLMPSWLSLISTFRSGVVSHSTEQGPVSRQYLCMAETIFSEKSWC
jgi:hypothetical protein